MALTFLVVLLHSVLATIDLNYAELEYLANHLLPQECRQLVAAAHFKSYTMPTVIEQAEQMLPKETPCIELLLHWNSADGEGRGETHSVLEHRLRQMGKSDLADWLGKTVFHELGKDLEKSLHEGLQEFANDMSTSARNIPMPTLSPVIEYSDPTEWIPFDTICLTLLSTLIVLSVLLCVYISCAACCRRCKRKKQRNLGKAQYYEMVEETSDSEDKFDIRQHDTAM